MSIYQRPHSVEISSKDYLDRYASEGEAKRRLFNIGSGSWSHPCWTNIDLPAQTAAFAAIQAPCIAHDLVADDPLPLPSESVDNFYCSHVIEHLPDRAVQNLMSEAFRCLDRGGCFRIVTGPCADLDWGALLRGDRDWWFWMNTDDFASTVECDRPAMTVYDRWLYHLATPRSVYSPTPCEMKFCASELSRLVSEHRHDPRPLLDSLTRGLTFNYAYPGDHRSWWNYPKAKQVLEDAGFTMVARSAYGQSVSRFMRDLRYFDQTYPQISVYIEALK